jgi:hypothetical protein
MGRFIGLRWGRNSSLTDSRICALSVLSSTFEWRLLYKVLPSKTFFPHQCFSCCHLFSLGVELKCMVRVMRLAKWPLAFALPQISGLKCQRLMHILAS